MQKKTNDSPQMRQLQEVNEKIGLSLWRNTICLDKPQKYIVVFPIASGILWGSAGVFVRKLSEYGMDNYSVLGSRMSVATLILLIALLIFKRSLFKIRLKDMWLFLGSGVLGILGLNFCYNEAVSEVTLALAAILLSLAPIFAMLLSSIIFKEQITYKKIGCMLFAFGGCVLASGVLENSRGFQWSIKGILMGILSAFFCALYGIFSKLAAEKGYHISTILFYSLLFIALILIPFTNWTLFGSFLKTSLCFNTVFAISHSVCTSILPYLLYSIALLHMENGKVSILAGGGEPIAAVIFGAIFFTEIPTIFNLIGLAITVLALSLLCRTDQKKS